MSKAAPPGKNPASRPADAEAARLLVDADAFLRLGLVDKAIAHLTGALARDPSLRALRLPLAKLYVARRRNHDAASELRVLLSSCESRQEEIRLLRYVLRLGEKDPVAKQRLAALLRQQPTESLESTDELALPDTAENRLGGELRSYLRQHQPPSDLMQTQDMPEIESRHYLEEQNELAATTNPNAAAVEAVAEEMALQGGSLPDELAEVERVLRQQGAAAALQRVQALAERFPHSKRVRGKLSELQSLLAPVAPGLASAKGVARSEAVDSPAAPTRKSRPLARPPARKPANRASPAYFEPEVGLSTLEVDPDDIKEERVLSPATATPRRGPPPPPGPSSLHGQSESPAAQGFRAATHLRSAGQHEQAIALLYKIRGDVRYSVAALLMIGLCYRDLDRLPDAIRLFLEAINLPQASDAELSELFYELGQTYELLANLAEAILYYQLSLGTAGSFRDALQRIAALQEALLTP